MYDGVRRREWAKGNQNGDSYDEMNMNGTAFPKNEWLPDPAEPLP